MTSTPLFSLLIATVRRHAELERLLRSLRGQTLRDMEILIADQNPPALLQDIYTEFSDLPIQAVRVPNKGVSQARNAIISLARGTFLAFPDDDCWYAPDTLAQAVEAFRRHPDAGGILGFWTPFPNLPKPNGREQLLSATAMFSQGGTCVQFFRAEAVKGIRFDPRLGPGTGLPYGCGEDTDYLLEVHKRAPVWRCPSIRVFHPSPDTHLPSEAKITAYAAGRMFLLKKHAFPLWFRCANVLYPLCMLPLEALRKGRPAARYRWRMFRERWRHL
ncbi:glycosyltransferase family 2 protein [uncultured Desulfovibrio sp.]|uniref:glycosyltransferase family 2 protein n=1 Tax=uncultured Desulfovibrio sp. TaxID=167968 RepID=UPI00261C8D5C|nr:glycosyltransferase family 2 protein [uncultured Desulfovibrio sp.]